MRNSCYRNHLDLRLPATAAAAATLTFAFSRTTSAFFTLVGASAPSTRAADIVSDAVSISIRLLIRRQTWRSRATDGLERQRYPFSKAGFPAPAVLSLSIFERLVRLHVRQISRKLRQNRSFASFGRACLLPYFTAYPIGYALQGAPSPLPIFFRQSVWFKLIVLRILHSPKQFVARGVFKNAESRKVSIPWKTYQVTLLGSHEHARTADESYLTRQPVPLHGSTACSVQNPGLVSQSREKRRLKSSRMPETASECCHPRLARLQYRGCPQAAHRSTGPD